MCLRLNDAHIHSRRLLQRFGYWTGVRNASNTGWNSELHDFVFYSAASRALYSQMVQLPSPPPFYGGLLATQVGSELYEFVILDLHRSVSSSCAAESSTYTDYHHFFQY